MTSRTLAAPSLVRLLGEWRGRGVRGPAYRQLADGLRALILDGRLPLGGRLPGERELAGALGLSRTTATTAFGLLRADGLLQSSPRSGFHVSLPADVVRPPAYIQAPDTPDVTLDLAQAVLPAAPAVQPAYARALEALPAYLHASGYDGAGLMRLRTAVAERYGERGLPTTPDQIVVTSGALHGFALLLRALTRPGEDRVVIEHPTFSRAIAAIQRAGCRPVPVSLPAEGWDGEGLAAAFRQSHPRLAYLVPDFHNPTGRCMGREMRARLAAAALETRTVLVFDETMTDLGLDVSAPAPDPAAEAGVVRLGSMGKAYWGGLRIGWIRGDPALVASVIAARSSIDLGCPVLEQLASAILLESRADIGERRRTLAARRDVLMAAMRRRLPSWRLERPAGGLSVWAELPEPVSSGLAAIASRYGLSLASGTRFGVDGAFERFVRLPYTQPADRLEQAVERLAQAYAAVVPTGAHPSRASVPLV